MQISPGLDPSSLAITQSPNIEQALTNVRELAPILQQQIAQTMSGAQELVRQNALGTFDQMNAVQQGNAIQAGLGVDGGLVPGHLGGASMNIAGSTGTTSLGSGAAGFAATISEGELGTFSAPNLGGSFGEIAATVVDPSGVEQAKAGYDAISEVTDLGGGLNPLGNLSAPQTPSELIFGQGQAQDPESIIFNR